MSQNMMTSLLTCIDIFSPSMPWIAILLESDVEGEVAYLHSNGDCNVAQTFYDLISASSEWGQMLELLSWS